jgi:hypothetical protein
MHDGGDTPWCRPGTNAKPYFTTVYCRLERFLEVLDPSGLGQFATGI